MFWLRGIQDGLGDNFGLRVGPWVNTALVCRRPQCLSTPEFLLERIDFVCIYIYITITEAITLCSCVCPVISKEFETCKCIFVDNWRGFLGWCWPVLEWLCQGALVAGDTRPAEVFPSPAASGWSVTLVAVSAFTWNHTWSSRGMVPSRSFPGWAHWLGFECNI